MISSVGRLDNIAMEGGNSLRFEHMMSNVVRLDNTAMEGGNSSRFEHLTSRSSIWEAEWTSEVIAASKGKQLEFLETTD